MSMTTIQPSIESVQQSLEQMIQTTNSLSEETIRWKPSEEEWSIMEILCHVLEAIPYWISEINYLKANPGAEWGRNHLQQARLDAVAAADQRSVEEIVNELTRLKDQVEVEFSSLDSADLAAEAPSRNPNFGTKPISFIVNHLIVEHASKHFGQIQRNLSKLG
ncbi:DinB family protein [Neobacillus drentensis]|uniref:DinB family protein n=1 Tax=Neobacillus drentensis TaxID=220684 RepID=UPI001F44EF55|nr:DinB family protein [Neobacillus drentensis]ULT57600.1 DinB family protein [Neobacillus drentensis]